MFDVITKADYFAMLDETVPAVFDRTKIDLKHPQDLWMWSQLRNLRDQRVLEIGGGWSRMLRAIDKSNERWNADEFLGDGGGPVQVDTAEGAKVVRVKMGAFSPELPPDYFDVAFSISVLEHVPLPAMGDAFRDIHRLLKPGGLTCHAIDIYVMSSRDLTGVDLVDKRMHFTGTQIANYLAAISASGLEFVEPPVVGPDLLFHSRYATNPDQGMHKWGQWAPSLKELRKEAQSISLKVLLRKPAAV